jgi:hypothetical protein
MASICKQQQQQQQQGCRRVDDSNIRISLVQSHQQLKPDTKHTSMPSN